LLCAEVMVAIRRRLMMRGFIDVCLLNVSCQFDT
jgi:hypothetical protein